MACLLKTAAELHEASNNIDITLFHLVINGIYYFEKRLFGGEENKLTCLLG